MRLLQFGRNESESNNVLMHLLYPVPPDVTN
jgi:hypothetical protein